MVREMFVLFFCFVALPPKSTAMVIAGWSVHLTTLFSWASLNKQLTSNRAHTFACNWQQPFMNDSAEGRRMTVEIISCSISTKVWDQTGIELATPGSAVSFASVTRHVTDCATRPCSREMLFEEIQPGCHGDHLGYCNTMVLANLNLPQCFPSSFSSIRHMVQQVMFEEFQDCILDISDPGVFLAIQNHQVTRMPLIKFRFNPIYGSRDVIWKISRWLPLWLSLILEQILQV